jgi:glycyl-tRNA synthetase beta chain
LLHLKRANRCWFNISSLFGSRGTDYDLVNAVLGEKDAKYTQHALTDLLDTRARALFLQRIRDNGTLRRVYPYCQSIEQISRSRKPRYPTISTHSSSPNQPLPKILRASRLRWFNRPRTADKSCSSFSNYQQLIDALALLTPAISSFFDGEDSVLVMDSNPEIKTNRLNLLGLVRNHARVLADFGSIVK